MFLSLLPQKGRGLDFFEINTFAQAAARILKNLSSDYTKKKQELFK